MSSHLLDGLIRINKYVFFTALLTYGGLFVWRPSLPTEDMVSYKVAAIEEPSQVTLYNEPPITLSGGDLTYTLKPLAQYEISGLVVMTHDAESVFDIFRKTDPLSTKDICMVWGENIRNESYLEVSYWTEDFNCHYAWAGTLPDFDKKALSNTHVIPANGEVARRISAVERGDQVRLVGYLVSYDVVGRGGIVNSRVSSLSRTDDVGEILYVTDMEQIRSVAYPKERIMDAARMAIFITFGIGLLYFIIPRKY